MKIIISILALMLVTTLSVFGQLNPLPINGNLTTNTGAILVTGEFTTNLPVHACYLIPVPKNGIGFYIRSGATNSASTTNATFVIEKVVYTSSGATNVVDNQTYELSSAQNGTTAYDFFTNIVNTSPNFGNAQYLRLRSIQNTNLASIWVSNLVWYSLP